MTTNVISPGLGVLSDDEETPVFESTAADCAVGIRKDLLSDFSVISPGLGHRSQLISDEGSEKVLVYVRIRPFVEGEREKKEDQGCVVVENQETLLLRAPKESFTMKNMERGMGQSIHKFTFSQIFGPEADQKQFFDGTMRRVVKDVLNGQNWLVYTYGVTNSGKTYTIQGNARDGGILPRSVSLIFNSSHERLYKSSDLKPLSNEVMWLDSKQVRQEELKKLSLLSNLREEELFIPVKNRSDSPHRPGTSLSYDSGIGGLSSTSHVTHTSSHLEESCSRLAYQDAVSMEEPLNVQLSIWVSYFEIYNEFVYDLLEPIPSGPNRKRTTLRLCEDRSGNPYVKDLNWINVHSAEEAWKIIRVGRKNQSFASTHLNQNSSRSHSIFSIRILHLQGNHDLAPKISELSFCDLAGSERCKDQQRGDRLKEATNINTSLHTLGRCIAALRQNQQQKLRQNVVPFRDSKLTRVFQAYFTGRGRSCMIVNINQCASTYDETLHAMKFSAIASQLVQAPITKMNVPSLHSLLKENGMLSNRTCAEDEDSEDLSDGESDDEADITMFNREELLQVVDGLKQLLLKERQEQFNLEMNIRKEVCDEMTEMMQQQKSQHSDQLEDGKALLEDLYDQRMENLKESFSNYYKRELEERDERIEELETALEESKSETLASVPVTRDSVPLRRSKRLATNDGPEMDRLKQELLSLKAELQASHEEIERNKKMQEPPVSAKPFTTDVDRKILEGQKNVRLLREELQKFGNSLQQVDRACCHTTGSERLRQALVNCDEILSKQEKTLAELQNNMVLVKMDLKKKAVCIAEQYNTVQKLQISTRGFKRTCNNENIQPIQSSEKRPFLRNLLSRTPGQKALTETGPYSRVLRARRSPVLKTIAFGTKF